MGLDITAYQKLYVIGTRTECTVNGDGEHLHVYNYDEFASRAAGLDPDMCYETKNGVMAFRAGSYSGYNAWRTQLCMKILHVTPEVVWRDIENFEGKPFFELIDFPDNEGIIGPVVSKKLAEDFAAYEQQIRATEDKFFVEKYMQWKRAFELAADGGAVEFH